MSARILVVDDEPQFERLIVRRLRKPVREGQYHFVFAADGVEALEKIDSEEEFDMVLADINMPRMDGLTLLAKLKEKRPLLKVVIVSAYGDMKNIRTAMNRGAFDFVIKPIDFADLEITIEKTLDEVRLLQQIEKTKELSVQNARLEELNRLKTQFFTNISHEFRTPLTIVTGMADQIEGNDKARRLIRRNAEDLLQLVNRILELQKLDAGHMQLELVQDNVVKYMEYLIESYHSLAASRNIQLHTLSNESVILMDYDAEKIKHIIGNLLSNAIKFTSEGGHIYLQINKQFREDGQFLQLSVKDTGVGIAEDELPHIFNRFYQTKAQSESFRTRQGQGTGIGLALTKELTELMGGSIRVESQEGKGSRFELNFPIRNEAVLQQATSYAALPSLVEAPEVGQEGGARLASDGPSLLIIEDNPDVAEYLSACLQDAYQLSIVADGQEGIDKALELIPDIIISDVMLPSKDGFEICATLKNDERSSHIPIILLTAKADMDSRIGGLSQGADAYLTKPFNEKELRIILRNLLAVRKKMHERYAAELKAADRPAPSADPSLAREDAFLQKVRLTLEARLSDPDFGIPQLCRAIQMSRSQLHNKLKALTGVSTSIFIRNLRLKKARQLLENSDLNVSEAAYDVGFKDPNYFSRLFLEAYGFSPSKVRK
ncbi:MAG: response regulator [Bacteroidota bacterium]